MIGILPDRVVKLYQIPEHSEAWTPLPSAMPADPARLPDALKRARLCDPAAKAADEFDSTGQCGRPAPLAERPLPIPA